MDESFGSAPVPKPWHNWVAEVKYPKYGNEKETVKASAIRWSVAPATYVRTPFNPKSVEDFDKTLLYIVESRKNSRDGNSYPYYAIMGKMAGKVADVL